MNNRSQPGSATAAIRDGGAGRENRKKVLFTHYQYKRLDELKQKRA
jgi:hypothetical protein